MDIVVVLLLSLGGVYLLAGVVASILVRGSDLKKKRISVVAGLEMAAASHHIAWLAYLLLWPVWCLAYLNGEEKGSQPVIVKYGRNEPSPSGYPEKASGRDGTDCIQESRKRAAEPGATDNPDGAQRLREDH